MSKYRFKFLTQSQLGQIFGASSHVIGNWLVEIGLRTESKKPSSLAFEGQYVGTVPSRNEGTFTYSWNTDKTVAALEAAGHERFFPAPLNLLEPPPMLGPFTVRIGSDGYRVNNPNGETVLQVQGAKNAELLMRMLGAAHSAGFLEKHLGNGSTRETEAIT